MTLEVRHVPIQYVNQAWPMVERFIANAVDYCGDDYTLDQVRVYVSSGQWLLVVAVDEQGVVHGAATINFLNYPNDRIGYITSIGGRLIANKKTFSELCEILKSRGATKIQGLGRPSIVRLWNRLGFEPISTLVEYKL